MAELPQAAQYPTQGATVFVDLERRDVQRGYTPLPVVRSLLAGRGANMFYLHRLLDESLQPLHPDIPLIFGSGVLTGIVPSAARVTGFRPAHDGARQHQVLPGARDVHHGQVARPRATKVVRHPLAHVDVVQPDIRRRVEERDLAVLHVQQRPRRRLSVQHDVIDAVHPDEGREVVAGVRVEQHAGLRRPRRGVAARRARHDPGQDARAENQRDIGMQRVQGLVEQPVQVEHVRAAPREQRPDDRKGRVSASHLPALEVDEDGRPLRRVLRRLGQFRHEPRHAIAHGHGM